MITNYHIYSFAKSKGMPFAIIFAMAMISLFSVSCNNSKNEIDKKHQSGVVLILNDYYYTLHLPSGEDLYLAGDSEGNITNFETDPDSIINCVTSAFGTGFFISDDGKIATNKHVVNRSVSDKSAVRFTRLLLNKIIQYLYDEIDSCTAIMDYCDKQYSLATDNAEKAQYIQVYRTYKNTIDEDNEIIRDLNTIDPSDIELEYNSNVSVAYNGSFVHSRTDFYPCTLRDTAEKDLAIIQLNSKLTPTNKHVFSVPSKNMLEHYSFGEYICKLFGSDKNDELYMIGFNQGLNMAITGDGIYSQCTEGSINREEKDIILYSINAEPGSSGSPVLNRRGELVAINFAGFKDAMGFNYGVKEQHLFELVNKNR